MVNNKSYELWRIEITYTTVPYKDQKAITDTNKNKFRLYVLNIGLKR